MAFYQFKKEQFIKSDIDTIWDFISSPKNLKKITPPEMGFDITSEDLASKVYQGMIISYHVKPILHIPTLWVTEITHVRDKSYFVDEQRVGPYKMWHHQHLLIEQDEGVLMQDIISYQPPMGLLGTIANALFIKKQLNKIFNYRTKVLNELFN